MTTRRAKECLIETNAKPKRQSKPVTITVDPAATNHPFGVWDYCTRGFVTKPGKHTIYVGNSADNTPHMATLTVG